MEVAERHPDRPVLHLPDVAQLVRDQPFGDVAATQEDDEVGREPVEAAPRPEAEQPRRDDDPDVLDPDRARPPVEPVEALLGSNEARVGNAVTQAMGSRTRTAERS
jgi:hypothetical protein